MIIMKPRWKERLVCSRLHFCLKNEKHQNCVIKIDCKFEQMNNLWKEIYFWAFLWKCVFVRFSFTWNILNKDIDLVINHIKLTFKIKLFRCYKIISKVAADFVMISKTKITRIKFQKYLKTVTIRETNIFQNVWKRRP